jgi:DNA-binding NtrC family response regulator
VGTSQNLKRAIDAGAFDFVQKPSTDARIANIVRRILEEGDHA